MEQVAAELPVLDRAWAWYQGHKKQTVQIATGSAVVILAVVGYFWWGAKVESSAAEDLARVEASRVAVRTARTPNPEAFLKVAEEHAKTKAGARARLLAGADFFLQGKYPEAQAQYQKFQTEYPDSPYRNQALLGVAACLNALGKTEEAATAYKTVVDRNPGEALLPAAKFALARIYDSQGKYDQAFKLYDELSKSQSGGTIATEAGLRAVELSPKLPPPVTPPPAAAAVSPTNAVTIPNLSPAPTAAPQPAKP